ncbi:GFA family protein [Altererythrobacter sp. ZODW24]|uniref:GFA family protein n=1 Tax=Altererythrobacter sp. ZODW24 TaxID=2185142 RepID=UPI000DF7E1F6|nr:GFA family protein [Altererythrobacter sp. ZODW24]
MMADTGQEHTGSCHCGSVKFAAKLPDDLAPHRCNCSMCEKKSTVVIDLPKGDLTVTSGEDTLSAYSFGTGVAKHWFCSNCGIQVYQNLRSDPHLVSVNAACIEGLDIWDFEEIPVVDGRYRHPKDTGTPGRKYIGVQKLVRE